MADYEVKAPPNLRSVDCCATCKWSGSYDSEWYCAKFRWPRSRHQPTESEPVVRLVFPFDICDAFEREVRA